MDASTLSLISTPGSTVLNTPLGSIDFSVDEFQAYKCIFDLIDIDDDGRICFNNSYDILKRSNIPRAILLQAWGSICAHKDEDVVLEQWLVLCKIISHIQMSGNQVIDIPKILTFPNIPFLDLSLRTTIPAIEAPYRINEPNALDIDVTGWEEVGEGLQKHVQYRVRYVTSLSVFTKSDWEVNRRYSDFKFLSELLQRYEGSLVPPLPPKQIINSFSQDLPAQRAQELNLFLKNIARHPALYGSYEFKIFVEASEKGFDAFKLLIKKVPEIEQHEKAVLEASQTPGGNASVNEYTAKASAMGSAAADYAWGMWTSVNKVLKIPALVSPPRAPVPMDPQLEEAFAYSFSLLHALGNATAKMSSLLDVNRKVYFELSKVSQYLRQAGELEGNRKFDRAVITCSKSIELLLLDGPSNLELQTLEIYFHLQNLARFHEVLQKNKSDREEACQRITDRHNKLRTAQNQLVSVQKISPGDVAAVESANDAIRKAEVEEKKAEQRHARMTATTKTDLQWLNRVAKFELQGRVLGFVQMRAVACQREVETWEGLLMELKGDAVGTATATYVEEDFKEDLEPTADVEEEEVSGDFM